MLRHLMRHLHPHPPFICPHTFFFEVARHQSRQPLYDRLPHFRGEGLLPAQAWSRSRLGNRRCRRPRSCSRSRCSSRVRTGARARPTAARRDVVVFMTRENFFRTGRFVCVWHNVLLWRVDGDGGWPTHGSGWETTHLLQTTAELARAIGGLSFQELERV